MYFHRTVRCRPAAAWEATRRRLWWKALQADQARHRQFHYIDFQDEKNAALTNGYQVGGPTLIVAQVVGNKVKHYKNLTEIWAKNGDKDEFLKYVRDNVAAYQKSMPKTAMKRKAEETSSKDKVILNESKIVAPPAGII